MHGGVKRGLGADPRGSRNVAPGGGLGEAPKVVRVLACIKTYVCIVMHPDNYDNFTAENLSCKGII
jgi:hypothetical protein